MRRWILLLSIIGVALYVAIGCPFRLLTGIPCPGCGMTRAFLSAFQLDFRSAFLYHPLFPVVLFCVGAIFLRICRYVAIHHKKFRQLRTGDINDIMADLMEVPVTKVVIAVIAAMYMAVYAIRMLVTLLGIGGALDLHILL
jgi:hypothetical protein